MNKNQDEVARTVRKEYIEIQQEMCPEPKIIQGKTTSAKIFTEDIEDAALAWVKELCNEPAMEGIEIVQMPDVHAGTSCNVGTAYKIGAHVNPSHVGVDIGCMVSTHQLSQNVDPKDFELLNHRIREVDEAIYPNHRRAWSCGMRPRGDAYSSGIMQNNPKP